MLEKVLTGKLTFNSLKPCDLSNCTKSEIKAYFTNSYDINESLFTSLKDDSVFYKCPDRLRLPLIFYYGHTACVYMNKLVLADLLKPADRVNFRYESLFETGVDEMSWDDTENYRMGGKFQWPQLDDVIEYRRKVRAVVMRLIDETPLQLPVTMDMAWWGLFMGMEHERIHIETSSVLIRQLPVDLVSKPDGWIYAPLRNDSCVKNSMKRVEETEVQLGKPRDFPSFGWDNEYGDLSAKVPAFEASSFLVTNLEFLEFVKAGGYKEKEYWTEEGWNWVKFREAKHPTFWVCLSECKSGCGADLASYSHCNAEKAVSHLANGQNSYCNGHSTIDDNGHQGDGEGGGLVARNNYRLRCMFDVVDMQWDWPAEVNYLEAKAFCKWKGPGFRLPGEAEHHVMRGHQKDPSIGTACDIIYQDKIDSNLNLHYGSSTPVDKYPPTELGFYDVFGNVWEWAEDHFNGLPGFQTIFFYDDFSTPCFDGRHNNMMGGSWMSTGDEASRFARFAFRRHFFQHAGFRVARSVSPEGVVKLPIRLVNTELYILDSGVQDNFVTIDVDGTECVQVESSSNQYVRENESFLKALLQSEYESTKPLAVEIVRMCKPLLEKYSIKRGTALHMGCGTGRGTFELAKYFDRILGQDYSARFINQCQLIQKDQSLASVQSEVVKKFKIDLNFGINMGQVIFKQLSWLPNEVEHHDFILINFFDRVQNIKAWSSRMREVLNRGGLLVIAMVGDVTVELLQQLIGSKFNMVERFQVPFEATDGQKEISATAWMHK